jgi:hypothetical protein
MSKEESIRRFSPYRIAEHWLNAVCSWCWP